MDGDKQQSEFHHAERKAEGGDVAPFSFRLGHEKCRRKTRKQEAQPGEQQRRHMGHANFDNNKVTPQITVTRMARAMWRGLRVMGAIQSN